jgi:hypothetical protein
MAILKYVYWYLLVPYVNIFLVLILNYFVPFKSPTDMWVLVIMLYILDLNSARLKNAHPDIYEER